jgi:hypothetical protein
VGWGAFGRDWKRAKECVGEDGGMLATTDMAPLPGSKNLIWATRRPTDADISARLRWCLHMGQNEY